MEPSADSTWTHLEQSISESLRRMRALAEPGLSGLGMLPGLVEVTHDSKHMWQAWWHHAKVDSPNDVCAVLPDLYPLLQRGEGTARSQWERVREQLAKSGISSRIIAPPSISESSITRTAADQIVANGLELRVGDAREWFLVSPGRAVIVPLSWESGNQDGRAIVLSGDVWPRVFMEVFEARWANAVPWSRTIDASSHILYLLSKGHQDAQVAEELGLSLRTVRRRIAEEMEAAGAGSRFELGVRYAQQEHLRRADKGVR